MALTEHRVYRPLERPWLYRAAQALLAPGARAALLAQIHSLLESLPPAARLLDLGCGPASWLWQAGRRPLGLDLSPAYSAAFQAAGGPAVTASAAALPFPGGSFDGVWSIGLLHHLPPALARQAVAEMARVAQPGGYVVIIDAVMPRPPWRRPLAAALRRLDRGRFVRRQEETENLLPRRPDWRVQRAPYSWNGMEVLVCWWLKGR